MHIAPTQEKPVFSIDLAAKTVGLVVLSSYVCGFLIVTLHLSSYGFTEVDPLKPRILTAGGYFLVALAFPIFAAAYMIRAEPVEDSKRKLAIILISIFLYYVTCQIVGVMLLALLGGTTEFDDLMVWGLVMTGWLIGVRKIVRKIPPGLLIVSAGAGILFLLVRSGLLIHMHRPDGAVELWLFLIGLEGRWDISLLQKQEERGKAPLLVILVLPALFVFATVFYPHISSSWGGGKLTPITLYFSKSSKLVPSGELKVQLIDESSTGLYVTIHGDGKAVFVPRASIALIHFSDKELSPSLLSGEPSQ